VRPYSTAVSPASSSTSSNINTTHILLLLLLLLLLHPALQPSYLPHSYSILECSDDWSR
jgi:hypothetical protein